MLTYLVRYNRATRSLDGLEEFSDFDAALRAQESAELENLHSGEDMEISVVTPEDLHRYVKPQLTQ